jgi:hypothetical protein
MSGNYIFVQRGRKAFKVASNFMNYLELGAQGLTGYYIEARVENDEFLINAILLSPRGEVCCSIVNNFPKQPNCRKEMTPTGYRIVDGSDQLLFGIDVVGSVCRLRGTIYDGSGGIVAQDKGDDFLVFHGPAILGKSGNSLGIVLK